MIERPSSETASFSSPGYAGDLSPREAWEKLAAEQAAQLVDVRTTAESSSDRPEFMNSRASWIQERIAAGLKRP